MDTNLIQKVRIELAGPNDLARVKSAEKGCNLSSWSLEDYRKFLDPAYGCLIVANDGERIIGFVAVRLITRTENTFDPVQQRIKNQGSSQSSNYPPKAFPSTKRHMERSRKYVELEICNLAVLPADRRQGIAKKLLQTSMEVYLDAEIEIFLEVRASNLDAQKFYSSSGFEVCGIRKEYYREPKEDAVLMKLALNREPEKS